MVRRMLVEQTRFIIKMGGTEAQTYGRWNPDLLLEPVDNLCPRRVSKKADSVEG